MSFHRNNRKRAFTLVEAMVSVVIIAVLLVVGLNVVGASGMNQYRSAQRATAAALAHDLMSDILQQPYKEPTTAPVFGPESGESASNKAQFDDVDDFNGWSESPPRDRANTALSDLSGWTRSVTVQWVSTAPPFAAAATDTSLKQITVTVRRNGAILASIVAIKGDVP
jgi:MSHA pilin protein MshD